MKKKSAFRILFPVVLITIIAVVAFLSTSWYVNRYMRIRLQDEFSKQSYGEYILNIKALRLNILTQSVSFSGIRIQPVNINPEYASYEASSSKLVLEGINVLGFLTGNKIKINSIKFKDPSITIIRGKMYHSNAADTTKKFSLYGFISQFAKSLTIQNFEITNFDFKLLNSKDEVTPAIHSSNNHFKIVRLFVGPSTDDMPGQFAADSIGLSMSRFAYVTADSLYTFDVASMQMSYRDSILQIDTVKMIPNFSKRSFGNVAGKQTDRFNISASKLLFIKIDLRNFFEYFSMISRRLEISGFSMSAFRDKNDQHKYAHPQSLQYLIKHVPAYLKIDTIQLKKSNIVYEEVAEGKKSSGRLSFNDISGNFTGLTNDSLLISLGRVMKFQAKCKLMNETQMFATYTFPLNTDHTSFKCSGFLTGMSIPVLNQMIAPLTGISIKKGIIDTLDFTFTGGENSSFGKMKLLYHDLRLEPVKTGEEDIRFKDRLNLFIANAFIIKDSNPRRNKPARIANMHAERDKQKFMFNYTWKTIYSGIQETLGIPEKKK